MAVTRVNNVTRRSTRSMSRRSRGSASRGTTNSTPTGARKRRPSSSIATLYVSTAWSKVFAFDATNGRQLWSYDPKVPRTILFTACCDAVNRGVAVSDGRIFIGTLDGRLIALDAGNGSVLWSVATFDQTKPYTSTGAPRVVEGRVLIGNSGAEYGVRGYLSAYDAKTGRLEWRFYTVPNPTGHADGQPSDRVLRQNAAKTWFGDGWKKFGGGGGTVWDAMAYDSAADLLYFGVGNGGPYDYLNRSNGKGDNLFLSSIVAVRPETGEYVWHYQTTPGDAWDYTATQQITLADIVIDGRIRHVLLQAPKNGFFLCHRPLDREVAVGDSLCSAQLGDGSRPANGTSPNRQRRALRNETLAAVAGNLGRP